MPALLFKLTNVPEDEAQEVRQLLDDSGFDVYETTAGRWQTGVAALWLNNEEQLQEAREVLDRYQTERARRARELFDEQRANGQALGVGQSLVQQPLRWLAYSIAAAVILGLMTLPFIGFLGN